MKRDLHFRFQALGFTVSTHNDKSKKEVLEEIHKGTTLNFNMFLRHYLCAVNCVISKHYLMAAAEANHRDADSFVCIFLTHGKEGQIYASDDTIKMEEITNPFRGDQCKSLVGKPKIFIFQVTVI